MIFFPIRILLFTLVFYEFTEGARVKKVLSIMFENHSFANMLGLSNVTKRGVNATSPSCNTQSLTQRVYCASNRGAFSDPDPDHSVDGTTKQLYGSETPPHPNDFSTVTLGGFVDSYTSAQGSTAGPTIMDCFDPSHVPIVSALAQSFTLVDTYFAGVPGPTLPNRLFYLSATSHGFGDNSDVEVVVGWPQRSIFGALDSANRTWRVYFSDVPSALTLGDTRGGLLEGKFKLIDDFAKDVALGDLPDFTFIEPGYFDLPGFPASDQHPAHDVRDGEKLLKGVYEGLRASPLWNESVLLVTWDEHGGFYDSMPPPVTGIPSPDGLPCASGCKHPEAFNFTRLGVRVPMLVVSPWATASVAPLAPTGSHYEHSSLSATLRQVFPDAFPTPLTARAAAAAPLTALWENSPINAPRTDTPPTLPPVPSQVTPSMMGLSREGTGPPNDLQRSLLLLAEATAQYLEGVETEADPLQGNFEALQERGALNSEASAGQYAKARLSSFFSAATSTG